MELKKTAQRIAIFNYIKDSNQHPSAREIYEHVSQKISCISLTTVYNTLDMLKRSGLIMELPHALHKEGRRFSSNQTSHDHLICNYCGNITDIDVGLDHSYLREKKYYNYDIQSTSLTVYGVCPECKRKIHAGSEDSIPTYQIKSSVKDHLLEIVVTGEITKYTYGKMFDEILELEKSTQAKNEIIDARELKGRIGNAEMLNYVRNYPAHRLKMNIAIVDVSSNVQIASFHEAITSNAGFNFKWFKIIEDARDWLKSR